MTTKTFTIVKRGRKFFDCLLDGKQRSYKAKLLINEISKDFAVDSTVTVMVHDVSTRTAYGSSMTFEPTDAQAEAKREATQRGLIEQEKWLSYAETDAARGSITSNAIQRTLADCHDPRFADRLVALKAQLDDNRVAKALVSKPAAKPQSSGSARAEQGWRCIFPQSYLPRVGVPFRIYGYGDVVVCTGMEGQKRIDADDPSVYGNHLLGHEGEWGTWCRFRSATEAEVAAMAA